MRYAILFLLLTGCGAGAAVAPEPSQPARAEVSVVTKFDGQLVSDAGVVDGRWQIGVGRAVGAVDLARAVAYGLGRVLGNPDSPDPSCVMHRGGIGWYWACAVDASGMIGSLVVECGPEMVAAVTEATAFWNGLAGRDVFVVR